MKFNMKKNNVVKGVFMLTEEKYLYYISNNQIIEFYLINDNQIYYFKTIKIQYDQNGIYKFFIKDLDGVLTILYIIHSVDIKLNIHNKSFNNVKDQSFINLFHSIIKQL
jgi:guanylate kinase